MKSKQFYGHFLSALCSSILSNPLYFSYFLFFSPYLLKLLAFLSPLFITTALLAGISGKLENLRRRFDGEELQWAEEFEVYKIVFGPAGEYPDGEFSDRGSCAGDSEMNPVEFSGEAELVGENPCEKTEEKVLGVQVSDDGGSPAKCNENSDERPGNEKPLESTPSSINGGNQTQQKPLIKAHLRKRGEALRTGNNGGNLTKKHDDYGKPAISPSLSDLGSARKEKEWRRTLACMLFEERHNAGGGGGGEGMDKLWEVYEKTEDNNGGLVDSGGNCDDDEDEEEEGGIGQPCCLQALKLSAGKMNFAMGKPGILKISKAFKGIGGGWLNRRRHQVHHHHHGGDSKKGSKF